MFEAIILKLNLDFLIDYELYELYKLYVNYIKLYKYNFK